MPGKWCRAQPLKLLLGLPSLVMSPIRFTVSLSREAAKIRTLAFGSTNGMTFRLVKSAVLKHLGQV
jgi:hypothetical protein